MAGNNLKVIKYSGLSSSNVKYPEAKTVIGTIIKGNDPCSESISRKPLNTQ
ncbi:hypothetical protein [Neobacillus rhizophilus]|uniref:Uncharacterized protein n=1 Tax=Neobacillus rhizophilus TaxID=2833579 RepID=A0A942U7V8_9BACI|nr:hypothetical protein [Neobacillus rhizophilus]MBS4214157.1 hypothetical protein [Neobacillus rhizophilus]